METYLIPDYHILCEEVCWLLHYIEHILYENVCCLLYYIQHKEPTSAENYRWRLQHCGVDEGEPYLDNSHSVLCFFRQI